MLGVPDLDACRALCPDLPASADVPAVLTDPRVQAWFADRLVSFAAANAGSSKQVERAMLLEEPPSLDALEVTDKGSLNQRAILKRRAALVDELYDDELHNVELDASAPSPRVIVLCGRRRRKPGESVVSTPPFRAEHVGSLLRPAALLQARTEAEGDQYRQISGPLKFDQLKQLEDSAIADVVKLQESVGLEVVTDGEFRRRSWFQDFLLSLSGTGITWVDAGKTISAALPFQNDTTVEKLPGHIVRVQDKLQAHEGGVHRSLRVPEEADVADAENQHPVAEHAALLGRPRGHRFEGLSRSR